MATEAQAAVMVAALINPPQGASGGSNRVQENLEAEVLAWFASAGVVGAPIANTFTDTGDLVGKVAHGLVAGDRVQFDTVVTTTGVVAGVEYYVIASGLTADAFKVAATAGGAALPLTTDGTGTYHKKAYASDHLVLAVLTSAQAQNDDATGTKQVFNYALQIAAAFTEDAA